MAAQRYDITIEQGADYSLVLSVKDPSGAPVNLTGVSVRAHIREHSDGPKIAEFSVQISNAAQGIIRLSIPGATSESLPPTVAFYDVSLARANGVRQRVAEGRVTISRSITHD
jgi:hypothetical protein